MARPDKAYLEKQTARRPEKKKKKKLNEGPTESRFAKISFKNYLRQIEEDEIDDFGDGDDLDEGYYDTGYEFPFIKIIHEDEHWYIVFEEDYQPKYWWNGKTNTWIKNSSEATSFQTKQDAITDYGTACDVYRAQFP